MGTLHVVSGFFADFKAKNRMILVKVTLRLMSASDDPATLPCDLQDTNSKDTIKQKFLPLVPLQLIHHVHRQHQNKQVRRNREHGIRIPRLNQIIAMSRLRLVPRFVDRYALEDASDGCGEGEETDEAEEEEDGHAVELLGHDAHVEEQDGDFVHADG